MRQWQKGRQNLCARNVGMNRRNGWENALAAVPGIR